MKISIGPRKIVCFKMTTSTEMPLEISPFSVICRGCLSDSGEMKNMIEWGFAEDFYLFTDVPVLSGQSSGSSELLCSSCEDSLVSCKQFRIQCQQSNLLLSNMGKKDTPKEIAADTNPDLKEHKIVHTMNATGLTINISTLDMDSKIYIPCPYKCGSTFIKLNDLQSHLAKSHNIDIKNYPVGLRYHCPYETCSHSQKNGKKHFTGRKYLNQHLNKMHLGEKSTCLNCKVNFSTDSAYQRHFKDCNVTFMCDVCHVQYKTHERLLVHLKRRHPELHGQYKAQRKMDKSLKRVSETITKDVKKTKPDVKEKHVSDDIYDSPKRSFATQTFNPETSIKNDVALPSWVKHDQTLYEKSDDIDRNFSTIQTQTVFEDLLSLKSQNSEDESIFFSETVSLSDIQTQTFPIEFGLSTRKETITSETQTRDHSPDLSIKETQTCYCHYDSPKLNFKLFDSIGSSPSNTNLTSTETQTADVAKFNGKSDVLLSFHSTETQTCFDEKKTDL